MMDPLLSTATRCQKQDDPLPFNALAAIFISPDTRGSTSIGRWIRGLKTFQQIFGDLDTQAARQRKLLTSWQAAHVLAASDELHALIGGAFGIPF
jgi:hypothetical protein